jgi:hypothetical protein
MRTHGSVLTGVGVALAALTISSVPALARVDKSLTLSAAAPSTPFEGTLLADDNAVSGNASAYGVDTRTTNNILIKVETAGRVVVKTHSAGPPTSEIDLLFNESDANGAVGTRLATGIDDGPDEQVAARVKPGYYLLMVTGYPAVAADYTGVASLELPPAPVVTPPAVVVPAVDAKPAAKHEPAARRKPSCAQKARRIKSNHKRKIALRKCHTASRKHR